MIFYKKRNIRIALFILIFISNINVIFGQISPRENAKLNYTQVMFEYPEIKNVSSYCIQVAENPSTNDFEKNITLTQKDSTTATLVNGLNFGSKYQWRYIAYNKSNQIIHTSKIYTFEILPLNHINKSIYRFTINKQVTDDGLLLLDGPRIAINLKGEVVWFLPVDSISTRCLRMTKEGSITYIATNYNYTNTGTEINIHGDTLWKTPSADKNLIGDSVNTYHHELVKLSNGNYMTMLNKYVLSNKRITANKICYSTIIEFDKMNNVVWHWSSENCIHDTDLFYTGDNYDKITINGMVRIFDAGHFNGFYLDELNDILYISARDISRIIKVDRKTGKILMNYGSKMPSGEAKYANDLFKFMHSPLLLPDGNIAVFSNNLRSNKSPKFVPASVVIFSQPKTQKDSSLKVWEFKCNFDTLYKSFSFGSGNVEYLDNKNFLVNMGDPIGRIFEVTPDKKVIWDCYPEVYSNLYSNWMPLYNYRVNYTKSLYPVYFTINNSINSDTLNDIKNPKIFFKINNEGSSNDSYIISYFINNKAYKPINTDIVPSNKTIDIEINLKKENLNHKDILITVCSSLNPKYKKELKFYIDYKN